VTQHSSAPADRTGDTVRIAGDYQHRARTQGFVIQRYWHGEKERVVRKFSAPRPGDRVLDVGSGSGVIADVLAQMGARVTGVDASEDAVSYARRTFARDNLDFRLGLVEEIDVPDESVDRTYCFELIEHIHDHQVRRLFETLKRVTKPGGVLTLTTPNYRGLWPLIELALDATGLVPRLAGDQHVTRFHRARLREMLIGAGWRLERLTTFSTFAPFLSVLGWGLAERVSALEDSLSLPFGNVILAIARKPA